jgi:hypothetical protein
MKPRGGFYSLLALPSSYRLFRTVVLADSFRVYLPIRPPLVRSESPRQESQITRCALLRVAVSSFKSHDAYPMLKSHFTGLPCFVGNRSIFFNR